MQGIIYNKPIGTKFFNIFHIFQPKGSSLNIRGRKQCH